jgi:hypothetical protein
MSGTAGFGIQEMERAATTTAEDLVLRRLETSRGQRAGTYCESAYEHAVVWAVQCKAGRFECCAKTDGR